MYKISVIIPVYNAAMFLGKSLNSLLMQTYNNLEIICINDGSTDNSLEILQEFQAKDSRIIVETTAHFGVASARNKGLELATGDFITFMDADDWVNLTLYETFIKSNALSPVDIWAFNLGYCFSPTKDVIPISSLQIEDWRGWKSPETVLTFDSCCNPFDAGLFVCNKIYRGDFIRGNNFGFIEGIVYEDIPFNFQTLMNAHSIKLNPEIFYWYNQANENSVTKAFGKNVLNAFVVLEEIENALVANGLEKVFAYAFFQYKYNFLFNLYQKTKFSCLKEFYKEMQKWLGKLDTTGLDPSIYTRLKNYYLYEKFQSLGWMHFYLYLKSLNQDL